MKRRLLIAAIFLLAGAVVNVAVAWVVVSHLQPRVSHVVSTAQPAEKQADWWMREPLDFWLRHVTKIEEFGWTQTRFISVRQAGWFQGEWTGQTFVYIYDAGLPVRCLSGTRRGVRKAGRRREVQEIRWLWRYPEAHQPSFFPLRPVWPGFAVNTFFYATFLWLLICGPLALRRFIRVRRGLCPACAYPRGESNVCSECGKALPGRARVTT